MQILLIDNTIDPHCWSSKDVVRLLRTMPGVTIHIRRAPDDDLPARPEDYDRIVASGSRTSATDDGRWIERLHDFMRRAISIKKPFLGICYGHQSLARALGGKKCVGRAPEPEFGWTKIAVQAPSALLEGLADPFYSFSSHFDEVCALPEGARLLARSELCGVQAFQWKDLPVFGIQFHPEKDLEGAKQSFAECRKTGNPKKLLHADQSQKYYDPGVGERIFRNFLTL